MKHTDDRDAEFAFSVHPAITATTCMNVRAGNRTVVAGDYSTYDGLRVGLLTRHTCNYKFIVFAVLLILFFVLLTVQSVRSKNKQRRIADELAAAPFNPAHSGRGTAILIRLPSSLRAYGSMDLRMMFEKRKLHIFPSPCAVYDIETAEAKR